MSTLRYEPVIGWEQLPPGFTHPDVAAVAIDSRSNVYLFCRAEHPVLVYDQSGRFLRSWGEGLFSMRTHGIAVDRDGRVFVCDRESDRIQVFDAEGRYEREITDVQRPMQIVLADDLMYVSELVWRKGQRSFRNGPIERDLPARVSVFDERGAVVARVGGPDPCAPGSFCAPHGLAVDANGDLYVAEVTMTIGVKPGLVPPDCHTFQKLRPVSPA